MCSQVQRPPMVKVPVGVAWPFRPVEQIMAFTGTV